MRGEAGKAPECQRRACLAEPRRGRQDRQGGVQRFGQSVREKLRHLRSWFRRWVNKRPHPPTLQKRAEMRRLRQIICRRRIVQGTFVRAPRKGGVRVWQLPREIPVQVVLRHAQGNRLREKTHRHTGPAVKAGDQSFARIAN